MPKILNFPMDESSKTAIHDKMQSSYVKEDQNKIVKNLDMDWTISDSNKFNLMLRKNMNKHIGSTSNKEVTDIMVEQIVAKARRLRAALVEETINKDLLQPCNDLEQYKAMSILCDKVYPYDSIFKKESDFLAEYKALKNAQSITSSNFITTPSEVESCKYSNGEINNCSNAKLLLSNQNEYLKKLTLSENLSGISLPKYRSSIKIKIESFSLTSSGYLLFKSYSLSKTKRESTRLNFTLQYKAGFINTNNVEISSKKYDKRTIYFGHEATYSTANIDSNIKNHLIFKIFVNYAHKNSSDELGSGMMTIKTMKPTTDFSITERVAIIKNSSKIGDLNVKIELNHIYKHSKLEYIDEKPFVSKFSRMYCKCMGGTELEADDRVSSIPPKKKEHITTVKSKNKNNDKCGTTSKDKIKYEGNDSNDNRIVLKEAISIDNNRVLLHGLIYIAEGKNLTESNTYVICRAFWRDDVAKSRLCNNTNNPSYQFSQLVPLIYGTDFLKRTKDNYIIVEVNYKNNNGVDNLLGIAKLSVDQLYIAYRDPLILSRLLQSKYPVICVDGWVPINNIISDKSCGELLALVALGTAEQIAHLKILRGLREDDASTSTISSPVSFNSVSINGNVSCKCFHENGEKNINVGETIEGDCVKDDLVVSDNSSKWRTEKTVNEKITKTEMVRETEKEEEATKIETRVNTATKSSSGVHALVDKLTLILNDPVGITKDNADNDVTQTRRSVGVGAEYDDALEKIDYYNSNSTDIETQNPNSYSSLFKQNSESGATECSVFRALVGIECALHLPCVEKLDETIEPSTYVTFQTRSYKPHSEYNRSCIKTNICPRSCNPKWNWERELELPTDLLVNSEARLILKVWRLENSDKSTFKNLEKDIVIGFAAVDFSILTTGLPVLSGWFNIIDFTGDCNGQLKIYVKPLQDVTNFIGQSSWLGDSTKTPAHNGQQQNESNGLTRGLRSIESDAHTLNTFSDFDSMSFLSSSLKQKLTELDEITKRLKSRLYDVTNSAFNDDFENDYNLNEINNEEDVEKSNEEIAKGTVEAASSWSTIITSDKMDNRNTEYQPCAQNSNRASNQPPCLVNAREASFNEQLSTKDNKQKTNNGPAINFNHQTRHTLLREVNVDRGLLQQGQTQLAYKDYPKKGSKVHIDQLLGELSFPFSTRLSSSELTATGSCNKQHYERKNYIGEYNHLLTETSAASVTDKKLEKMSTVLRQELVADENDDNDFKPDDLSTYLIASNVHHTDLKNTHDCLLYRRHFLLKDDQEKDVENSHEFCLEERPVVRHLDSIYACCNDLNEDMVATTTAVVQRNNVFLDNNVNEGSNHATKQPLTICNKEREDSEDNPETVSSSDSTTTMSLDRVLLSLLDSSDVDISQTHGGTIVESPGILEESDLYTTTITSSRQAPDGGNPMEDNGKDKY
ncbi:uncharacterized protein [Prorops nasuta]